MKKNLIYLVMALAFLAIITLFYWVGLHTGTKKAIDAYRAGYLEIDTNGELVVRTDPVHGWQYPDIPIKGNKIIFVPAPSKVQKISLEDEDEMPVQAKMTPAMSAFVLPGCGHVTLSVVKLNSELSTSHSAQALFDACQEQYKWKALSSLSDANLLPRHLLSYDRSGKGLFFFFRPAGSTGLIQVGHMAATGVVKEVGSPILSPDGQSITQMVQDGNWIYVQ